MVQFVLSNSTCYTGIQSGNPFLWCENIMSPNIFKIIES
jgi:hypothetical protein